MIFLSNQKLINYLEESGVLRSLEIKEALLKIDRKNFVSKKAEDFAYYDQPILILDGQTISQPTTVVFMLELLNVQPGDRILDIGAGSGWVSGLLSCLTGKKGNILACEINKKIGKIGKKFIDGLNIENIDYNIGNAVNYWKKEKFDRIYSGAAFKKIPKSLLKQLKNGGILVAPTQENDIRKIIRLDNHFKETIYSGFAFVPFINGEDKQGLDF